jgi:flagellar M-ring protein FliF
MNDIILSPSGNLSARRTPLFPVLEKPLALLRQPAVRRALPAAFTILGMSVVIVMYLAFREPVRATLLSGLGDAEKASVITALRAAKLDVALDTETGAVQVPMDQVQNARMILATQGLPDSPATGYDLLSTIPLGTSRAIEEARLHQTQETELARSIMEITGISSARVHLATPEQSAFVRSNAAPSASVFIKLLPGRVIDAPQVTAIRQLVASSVPGLSVTDVSVIDQRGSLLSPSAPQDAFAENERQLKYRQQLEQSWRQQISTILSPILGPDGFSTEVALDLDFTEKQSTREAYDPATVLRSEQATKSPATGSDAPSGIPGALSNLVPPATQAVQPSGPTVATPAPAIAGAPPTAVTENYTRNFEIGKEVSVHKSPSGEIRRASVAVIVRDKTDAKGKALKRTSAELAMMQKLVASAVGLDAKRGDTLTLSSSTFADTPVAAPQPIWEKPWPRALGQSVVAVIIFALGLFFGLRPLLKALNASASDSIAEDDTPKFLSRKTAESEAAEIAAYHEKMTVVQNFVRSDEARASLALKQMLHNTDSPAT